MEKKTNDWSKIPTLKELEEFRNETKGVVIAPPMDVRIIAIPPELEKLLMFAASTTYKGHEAGEYEDTPIEYVRKVLPQIIRTGHTSVIEHGMITFDVRNVSRALTHQLVRHRMASYTQESQHYITYRRLTVVAPKGMTDHQSAKFFEACSTSFECYRAMVDSGYPSFEARAVLPNAVAAKMVVSMNARALYNFFGLRRCERNTWEIRELAERMWERCMDEAPLLFKGAGPRCEQIGYCPEGKRSCGKRKTREELGL